MIFSDTISSFPQMGQMLFTWSKSWNDDCSGPAMMPPPPPRPVSPLSMPTFNQTQ